MKAKNSLFTLTVVPASSNSTNTQWNIKSILRELKWNSRAHTHTHTFNSQCKYFVNFTTAQNRLTCCAFLACEWIFDEEFAVAVFLAHSDFSMHRIDKFIIICIIIIQLSEMGFPGRESGWFDKPLNYIINITFDDIYFVSFIAKNPSTKSSKNSNKRTENENESRKCIHWA